MGVLVFSLEAGEFGVTVRYVGPLRRLLVGSGRLPPDLRAAIATEQLVVLEEELPGSVIYRRYRAPGRYSRPRTRGAMGSIALTDRRLLVWANHVQHVNVLHHDPLRAGIKVTVDQPNRIWVRYEAGDANPRMSGQIEVRLRTTRASTIAWLCRELAAH
jgi:hypothetical protein